MSDWSRVSRAHPCPICQAHNRCTVSSDGKLCKCTRKLDGVVGHKPVSIGSDAVSSWALYELGGGMPKPAPSKQVQPIAQPWVEDMARRFHREIDRTRKVGLAQDLGLSLESLDRMRVGWVTAGELAIRDTHCQGAGCWTFPMRDATGRVVGVRLRSTSGFKYQIAGTSTGVFIPTEMQAIHESPLLIVEGPTDCAAALDLGFNAIGRPNNTGGVSEISKFISAHKLTQVYVVIDRDVKVAAKDQTERGLHRLINALTPQGVSIGVVRPRRAKDIRQYLCQGGTREGLLQAIKNAEIHRAPLPNVTPPNESEGAPGCRAVTSESVFERPPKKRDTSAFLATVGKGAPRAARLKAGHVGQVQGAA